MLLELLPQGCAKGGLALPALVELLEFCDEGFVAPAVVRVVLADDSAACLDVFRVLAEALVAACVAGLVGHGSLSLVVGCPGLVLALLACSAVARNAFQVIAVVGSRGHRKAHPLRRMIRGRGWAGVLTARCA